MKNYLNFTLFSEKKKNASRKVSETACREKYQLCLNTFQALWPICCSPLVLMVAGIFWSRVGNIKACIDKGLTRKKMPKIDTLDALEEHEEHEDDYQTNSNW